MIEFFVRLGYFAVVLGLYFLGIYLSPSQKMSQESIIDFKLLLPLFSLVFLEFFIRKFSPFYHKVKVKNIRFESECLFLEFLIHHWGSEPCHYSYGGLSGIKSDVLSLQCRFSNNDVQFYNVPELFATTLNREKKIVSMTLQSSPGTAHRKILKFHNRHYFFATLWIKVNLFAIPHVFLIKVKDGK